MASNQNHVVYVGNPNQQIMNQQANAKKNFCAVALIMFGVFLCFPGTFVTATGASYVAGPILLCVGLTLLAIGTMMCVKNRKNMTANLGATAITTTTVQQQQYVVQQGNTTQHVTMQTNIHPTTTVYQAGQPQMTTMYHQQSAPPPAQMPYPEPQGNPSAFPPPTAPGYPPSNPVYPPTAPGYEPPSSQGFTPGPPSYDDVVKN